MTSHQRRARQTAIGGMVLVVALLTWFAADHVGGAGRPLQRVEAERALRVTIEPTVSEAVPPTIRTPTDLGSRSLAQAVGDAATRTESGAGLGTLVVTLRTSGGLPVQAGRVRIRRSGSIWGEEATDPSGAVRFRGLEPGRYEVVVGELQEGLAPPAPASHPRVRADEETRHDLTCLRLCTLRVRLHDRRMVPLVDQTVMVTGEAMERTDVLGVATFERLVPGTYTVSAALDEGHPARIPASFTPVSVELLEGTDVEVALPIVGTNLSLTVDIVDVQGRPLVGQYVHLRLRRGPSVAVAAADAYGTVRFDDCPRAELFVTPIDLPRASNSATPRGVAQLAPQLEYDLRGASASPPHGRLVLETPNDDAVLEIELVPPPAVGTAPSTPSSRWFPTPALSIGIVHGTPPAESHRTIEARAWRDVDGLYRFRVDPSVTRITVSTTPQFGEMAPFEPQRGRLHRLRLVGDRLESR